MSHVTAVSSATKHNQYAVKGFFILQLVLRGSMPTSLLLTPEKYAPPRARAHPALPLCCRRRRRCSKKLGLRWRMLLQ